MVRDPPPLKLPPSLGSDGGTRRRTGPPPLKLWRDRPRAGWGCGCRKNTERPTEANQTESNWIKPWQVDAEDESGGSRCGIGTRLSREL